jgi:hypothetical protein
MTPIARMRAAWPVFLFLIFSPARAFAYRPFVSTDAAVAAPGDVEIELGYFNFERDKGRTTFIVPKTVLNYGIINNLEVVGEFAVEEPLHRSARLVDAALSLKAVLKEGVLQDRAGLSFAVEAGALMPSSTKEEKRFGFEGTAILSGKLEPLTYHLNLGGGIDRARSDPFAAWGAIAEFSVTPKLRLVGEISGESVRGNGPDVSALIGLSWNPSQSTLAFDAGLRRGITRASADWMFTTGLTFSFSLFPSPTEIGRPTLSPDVAGGGRRTPKAS